ncbi:MAG: hypothetical protein LBQ75_02175 [Zoogloeaceae bacterium]|nr:hypothetical protein [Zoogloeaceae bacterium]
MQTERTPKNSWRQTVTPYRTPASIWHLAQTCSGDALYTLYQVMDREDSPPQARIAAANAILDHAFVTEVVGEAVIKDILKRFRKKY